MKKIYLLALLGSLSLSAFSQTQSPNCFVQIQFNSNANLCFGDCNGTATTFPVGTGPFTYLWSNSATTQNLSGLCVGSYTCTVTDIGANTTCSGNGSITCPSALNESMSTSTNSATAVVSGGTFPYTYSWAPGGQTTMTATGLSTGTYTCYVTDANGCTISNTVNVSITGIKNYAEADGGMIVYPNPAKDFLFIEFNVDTKCNTAIVISNIVGEVVLQENAIAVKSLKHIIDISSLSKGVYFISANMQDKVITKKIVIE